MDEIIAGLVLVDVAATLAGNWMIWGRVAALDVRLSVLESRFCEKEKA